MSVSGRAPLLPPLAAVAPKATYDTFPWRLAHAFFFLLGGTTFILGTGLLWLPDPSSTGVAATASAAFYTLGSLGFLAVDVMESFAFSGARCGLRVNIACSAIGSTLYLIGSVGFFPAVPVAVGVWGFVLGSGLLILSQGWKVARFICEARASGAGGADADDGGTVALESSALAPRDLRDAHSGVHPCVDAASAVGVEGSAGIGAAAFFSGTFLYFTAASSLAPTGNLLTAILALWMIGSVAYTSGACFLCWRHFVLHLT